MADQESHHPSPEASGSDGASGSESRVAARVEELVPLVYGRLRGLARRYLRGDGARNSLTPTDLVHEAYLRTIHGRAMDWRGKTHFFAIAATQMRRILVEHARRASAHKRGMRSIHVTLHEGHAISPERTVEILALDEALEHLAALMERQSRVAEMRLFAGMETEEIGHVLGVSSRTVKSDWAVARAWLARELRSSERSRP